MRINTDGKIVIGIDDYIGAVRATSIWHLFYATFGMWILDYASYQPHYDPTEPKYQGWRKNILRVDETKATEYIGAMTQQELHPDQIRLVVKNGFKGLEPLSFVVNFDEKLFVNGWHDNIPVHEYVPKEWTSLEDDPLLYVPQAVRDLWK